MCFFVKVLFNFLIYIFFGESQLKKNIYPKKCWHIFFYLQGPGWEFETELPEWAKVDWVEPEISE